MKLGVACPLVLVLAGGAQGQGLRIRVVDAQSGQPVVGATVERWASQWQPRILRPPGKFWFPEKAVATDADGRVAINKVAADDWYAVKAVGYEGGKVERVRGTYQLTAGTGGLAQPLADQSGVVIVLLKPTCTSPDDRK